MANEIEMFPCANIDLELQDREAIREAGRWGLAYADASGEMTPEGCETAADRIDKMAKENPGGPYALAVTKLRLGDVAALQCVRNQILNGCPFRCLDQKPVGTLDV